MDITLKIVAAITGLMALLLSFVVYRLSRKIARVQGTLKETDLKLFLFDDGLVDSFIFAIPFKQREIQVPLHLFVVNVGERTAKDVDLNIRCTGLLFGGYDVTVDGHPDVTIRYQTPTATDEQKTLIIRLDHLHPHTATALTLFVLPQINLSKMTFSLDFKDIKNVTAETWLEVPFVFEYFLTQENMRPLGKRAFLYFADITSQSVESLFAEYNETAASLDTSSLSNQEIQSTTPPAINNKSVKLLMGSVQLDRSQLPLTNEENRFFGLVAADESDIKLKRSTGSSSLKENEIYMLQYDSLSVSVGFKVDSEFVFPARNIQRQHHR